METPVTFLDCSEDHYTTALYMVLKEEDFLFNTRRLMDTSLELHERKACVYHVDADGVETWKTDGVLDRKDGPAIRRKDGSYEYWSHGFKVKWSVAKDSVREVCKARRSRPELSEHQKAL